MDSLRLEKAEEKEMSVEESRDEKVKIKLKPRFEENREEKWAKDIWAESWKEFFVSSFLEAVR